MWQGLKDYLKLYQMMRVTVAKRAQQKKIN